jgi:hypothetical protein
MMGRLALLVVLLVGVPSWAQAITPPPPPPPQAAPAPADPGGIKLSEQQEAKTKRHSKFSAGPGGPLLIFTEVITGFIVGGLVGSTYNTGVGQAATSGTYFGLLAGGLVMGGAAAAYQYAVPVGRSTSGIVALGAGVGALAAFGFGLAAKLDVTSVKTLHWLLLIGSQLGVAAPLLATLGIEDLSVSDAGVIGMCTLYATALTALALAVIPTPPGWPILVAPAVGYGLGGIAAMLTEVQPGRVLKLTALPLGVGLILFYLGSLSSSLQLAAATSLIGIGVTFGLTYIFTAEDPAAPGPAIAPTPATSGGSATITPIPVIIPGTIRNPEVAIGPGVAIGF